jgi:hypothetical protein
MKPRSSFGTYGLSHPSYSAEKKAARQSGRLFKEMTIQF